jgi:uncharacterized protein YecE (DUF72 family)
MAYHVGTSGWSYDHWQGILYPHNTPVKDRLPYYLERWDTVEVNATYYRWPRDVVFSNWRARLPEGFLMTVKASQGLSHRAKLKNPERWLEITERSLRCLGEKLGVLLIQLPPNFGYDHERLRYFLEQKPCWIRTAIEFRHPTWHRDEVFHLLEQHGVAYCVMSGAHLPCILRATAPFVYVRFHGPDPEHLYGGSYSDDDMRWWADRFREWRGQDRDVWGYFNNDGEGNALRNAGVLKAFLGL